MLELINIKKDYETGDTIRVCGSLWTVGLW